MNNDDLERLDEPGTRPDAPQPNGRSDDHYYAAPSGEREVHLLDYVRVLYKRRWIAITAFLLVLGSVGAYTFTATPIFEAKTRLLIESDDHNVISFEQVVDEQATRPDYYQTQFNILQSRALARKTMDDLNLWKHFGDSKPDDASLWRSIEGMFPSRAEDAGDENDVPAADETLAQSRAMDAFLGGLDISPIRNSRLIDVKYRSPDARLAAAVADALAKNYIEQNLEYKFLASQEASEWLGERLAEQRKQVEAAELALQRYREQNAAISLEASENFVVQKLGDLNSAVTRAKTIRIEKEALYNQLRASQINPAALDTFPAILTNNFIQQQKSDLARLQREQAQLAEKLGDKHPDMQNIVAAIQISQAKLNGEIGKVVQAVRSEYQSALAQENSLSAALDQQKSEALAMNRKGIEYGVLAREVESARGIYQSLLQRANETGVSSELKTSNIRIVDEAEVPGSPISPRRRFNILMSLLIGLLIGTALAVFVEYLDNRIKLPDEITAYLALPSLGLIPALKGSTFDGAEPLLSRPVAANFGEALRIIRTNVVFSGASAQMRSIAVTSSGPGEGKTTVACNLAISLAQAGYRVLIIDADMRRPKLHEVLAISQEPGLSNLLVGTSKASESVRRTSTPGLWALSSGRIPPNPSELLASTRFATFFASLVDHFQYVIVDTPPVLAVTDTAVLAHHVTATVFVVGAEMTSRRLARAAVDQLNRAGANVIGAVLNRVDLDRNPYYYSQYYRREYAAYYTSSGATEQRT